LLQIMIATTSLSETLTLYETEFLAARNLAFRSRRANLASNLLTPACTNGGRKIRGLPR
jgi:hypothetical protein